MPETSREPCPDRILDNMGGNFGMGIVGGSAFHFLKGIYNSPKGSRFVGGAQAVRMNAPRLGGRFAVWGGLFSAIDCTMVYIRQKEDPWNSIIAAAAAAGLLELRRGPVAVANGAVIGGAILAMVLGSKIILKKLASQHQDMTMMEEQVAGMQMGQMPNQAQVMPQSLNQDTASSSSSSSSWLRGLFSKKNDEVKTSSGSKTMVLESFDAPPVPSFEFK